MMNADATSAQPLAATQLHQEDALSPRKNIVRRISSKMTDGGIRQSTVTLVSTAMGAGVLSVSYVMFLCGLGLGMIMLVLGATLAYVSVVALMDLSHVTGRRSFAGVFAHCAGAWAEPTLDGLLFIFGNGICIGYLVFLSDFIPPLMQVADSPEWLRSRAFAIVLSAILVSPMAVQKNLGILRYIAPLSLVALAYTTIVIAAQTPRNFVPIIDRPDKRNMPWFNFNVHLPEAFAICVFAYNCHLNVVPIASGLVRPTYTRIRKVGKFANIVQCSFYLVMAVAGHLSFVEDTPQDILTGYDMHDSFIIVARVLLSISILIAMPMNFVPTMESGAQLFGKCCCRKAAVAPVVDAEAAASPLTPRRNEPVKEDDGPGPLLRIPMALTCLCINSIVAINVPGIATVISLLGGTVATLMMFVIPAYCIRKVLPRTPKNNAKVAVLYFFSLFGFASVPVTVLELIGVIPKFQ